MSGDCHALHPPRTLVCLLVVIFMLACCLPTAATHAQARGIDFRKGKGRGHEKKTTGFVPNVGQYAPETRFQTGLDGGRLRFTQGGIGIDVFERKPKKAELPLNDAAADPAERETPSAPPAAPAVLTMRFDGANVVVP